MKKNPPEPPMPLPRQTRNVDHDRTNAHLLAALATHPVALNTLNPTRALDVGPNSIFRVREGVTAEEALRHVALLLKCAAQVSDEISERGSGIETGLVWSMIHSVEMARAVVDALIEAPQLAIE